MINDTFVLLGERMFPWGKRQGEELDKNAVMTPQELYMMMHGVSSASFLDGTFNLPLEELASRVTGKRLDKVTLEECRDVYRRWREVCKKLEYIRKKHWGGTSIQSEDNYPSKMTRHSRVVGEMSLENASKSQKHIKLLACDLKKLLQRQGEETQLFRARRLWVFACLLHMNYVWQKEKPVLVYSPANQATLAEAVQLEKPVVIKCIKSLIDMGLVTQAYIKGSTVKIWYPGTSDHAKAVIEAIRENRILLIDDYRAIHYWARKKVI